MRLRFSQGARAKVVAAGSAGAGTVSCVCRGVCIFLKPWRRCARAEVFGGAVADYRGCRSCRRSHLMGLPDATSSSARAATSRSTSMLHTCVG